MDLLAYDPATGYAEVYKEQFAAEAENFFEDALTKSKIDPEENARLASALRKLQEEKEHCSGRKILWILLLTAIIILFLILALSILCNVPEEEQGDSWVLFFLGAAAGAGVIIFKLIPRIKALSSQEAALKKRCSDLYDQIIRKLAPLYRYFTWHTLTDLFSRVITPVEFDDFLSNERLEDLKANFGLAIEDEPNSTLTGTYSGTFYGYPFVFTEDISVVWGTRVWSGSLPITYREKTVNAEGKTVWVTRTQILTATVTKPAPEFPLNRNFFFGHHEAPNLSFSRTPSSLSGGEGFWHNLGKKYQLRQLRKFEQNLTDKSQYTMVANHDFEVLFRSENRNNEVEFRMLYTPLAQQYMVKLLNDTEAGFGDDFACFKKGCITRIVSEHLNQTSLSEAPFRSDKFDLKEIKELFLRTSGEFFKSFYFSFAPVFLIPSYNAPRLKGVTTPSEEFTISPCEIEGAAYAHSRLFAPHESITENIFNVSHYSSRKGTVRAVIESIGYAGVEHVEYVSCYGKDGRFHDVPVPWVEYVPVSEHTPVMVWKEKNVPPDAKILFSRRGIVFGKVK